MYWHEEFVVTLTNRTESCWATILTLLPLNVLKHSLERIWFLLYLTTTNFWQQEVSELVYVRLRCVDLSTCLACKVFLRLSILDCSCSHHSTIYDHIFVNMALSHVSN